jgi:LysR family transcriptional regulator, cyn operon transcriptional activator
MELRQLRYFVALAEWRNFTRAARAAHVTQSTLSHGINRLEEEIGYRLFERTQRTVALTREGEALFPGVVLALKELGEAIRSVKEAAGELTGSTRVLIGAHAFAVGVAPKCLEQFLDKHPRVQVTMDEVLSLHFLDRLKSEPLDFDFGVGEQADAPGLTFEPLYLEEFGLAVSRNHPLAHLKRIRLIELHRLRLALPTKEIAARRVMDKYLESVGAEPNIVAEVSMVDSLFQIARESSSIAVVLPVNYFSRQDLVHIAIEEPTPLRTIGLFWPGARAVQPFARLFADVIRRVVSRDIDQHGWPRIHPFSAPTATPAGSSVDVAQ